MHPILFTIGEKLTIYSYGLMIALGMITCVAVAYVRAGKRYATDPDILFNCALIGIVSGMLGAKLTYWIVELLRDPKNFDFGWQIEHFTAGFVIYGGLILGVLCCLFYVKKIKKMSFLRIFDIAVASIAIGQGIGRIGCFLAGCCYGAPIPEGHWLSFIGVIFPNEALCEAPAGVLLWPTQLISAAGDLLLAAFLLFYTDRERFAGETSVFYIGLYAIGRFLVEFLRNDPRGTVGPFSTSQFIAIIMLVLAVALWFVFRKMNVEPLRPVGPYQKEKDDDDDEDEEEDEEETEPAEDSKLKEEVKAEESKPEEEVKEEESKPEEEVKEEEETASDEAAAPEEETEASNEEETADDTKSGDEAALDGGASEDDTKSDDNEKQ